MLTSASPFHEASSNKTTGTKSTNTRLTMFPFWKSTTNWPVGITPWLTSNDVQSGGRYFIYIKIKNPAREKPPTPKDHHQTKEPDNQPPLTPMQRHASTRQAVVTTPLLCIVAICTWRPGALSPQRTQGALRGVPSRGRPTWAKTAQPAQQAGLRCTFPKTGVPSRGPGSTKGSHLSHTQHVHGTKSRTRAITA
jgi:hypothetical protein